jgi:hypothetical protein
MASDVEIDRALAAIAETLNDQKVSEFDRRRVQEIVTGSLGEQLLDVDDGGGLHDDSGTRVGCIRKTPSGEWIVERQNAEAAGADAEIPAPAPGGEQK